MKTMKYSNILRLFLVIILAATSSEANVIRRPDNGNRDADKAYPSQALNIDPANAMQQEQKARIKDQAPVIAFAPPDHNDGVRLMKGGQLNKEYKQEVFLGPDHSDFENISEKEGKQRLMEIFKLADTSKDALLDLLELTEWISLQTEKHFDEALEASRKIFPFLDSDSDGKIHWSEYREQFLRQRGYDDRTLQALKDGKMPLKTEDEDDYLTYRDRWSRADEDNDDILNQEEFLAFLHPEHCKTMLHLLVDELLHDFDTDGDGKLSRGEFVSLPEMEGKELDKAGTDDEWVRERIKEFKENMDLNHDGICDKEELVVYVDPRNRQHAEGEASHLIGVADENEDMKLSPKEVLNNYYIFIGSKLYNYGRNVHDEF